MSKVFICYAHKDEKYFKLVTKHLTINKKELDIWSDKRLKGADKWRDEIDKALDTCNLAVLIISANFFNSDFIQNVELNKILEHVEDKNTKLLPILAEDCDIEAFNWIESTQLLPSRDKPLEIIKKKQQNAESKKISQRIRELLKPVPDSVNTKKDVQSHNYPDAISENNFPTSNDKFFGREKYIDILDKAWGDEQVNILSFIAFGGIGKTSLIDNWLKKMKESHYKGAKNIFMWSFYSQGSQEDRQVTATEFLLEACKFFKIKKIPKTAYEQGRELADIISKQRALIVLDGLEPLQSSLENIGEIKDNGLQVLLKRLSRQNKGLIIVTSRIKLSTIDNEYIPLEKLEDDEGAELLKSFELNGTQEELEKISNDFDGHALALKLLGSYTKVVLDKDISRIDEIENLTDAKGKSSKHANRMLNSYRKYLQREGNVELDILKILGFFDRAISFDVIDELKNKPLIENINDNLVDVSEIDWKYALNNLKELHLISSSDKFLDTHPLVREYFSKYISKNYEYNYIQGHHRLYKYYEQLPEKEYPDTIEEMEPLFQAIYHGCKADKHNEAIDLFTIRIDRAKEKINYLCTKLGRFDLYFKLMSHFFEKRFTKITEKISELHHNKILVNIAYYFSTKNDNIKTLNIYLNLLECSLINSEKNILISNILDLYLYMGEFEKLETFYLKNKNEEMSYNDKAWVMVTYAYFKFLSGDYSKSKEFFENSEKLLIMCGQRGLHNFAGYMYKNFLIYTKDYKTLSENISGSITISKELKLPLDNGLNYITLGRYKLLKNDNENDVIKVFNKAILFLRKSNETKFISEGLIYRAETFRHYKKFKESNEDLLEAYDFNISLEAKLLLANWYVVAIKLALDEENSIKANTYFKEAKDLSKELNEYFIFKEELKKLEQNFDIEVTNENSTS